RESLISANIPALRSAIRRMRSSPAQRLPAYRIPEPEILLLPFRVGAVLSQGLFRAGVARRGHWFVVAAAAQQKGRHQHQERRSDPHLLADRFYRMKAQSYTAAAALKSGKAAQR